MNSPVAMRRRADEDEEEARSDHFGDQQHDAADQPQPAGIHVEAVHDRVSGTPDAALGFAGAGTLEV